MSIDLLRVQLGMDPYTISTVIWENDGSIKAYNDAGELVTKLTAKGLEELGGMVEDIVVEDRRVKTKAPELPKGNYERSVIAVATEPVDRNDLPTTLDGVTIGIGDRVLLLNQDKPHWNGIHRVVQGRGEALKAHSIPVEAEDTLLLVERGIQFELTLWQLKGGVWGRHTG